MTEPVLTQRALNRALLARQMLLERTDAELDEVLKRMAGIQMQYAPAGYIGLWSRMRAFERADLTRALEERRAIQGTMMRATIHTVSVGDYWPMMAGIRRVNREWYSRVWSRVLAGIDIQAVAEAVHDELADGPLRRKELEQRIEARGFPARTMTTIGLWVDIVRVPPSGTWDRRRADLYGLAEQWLTPVEMAEDDGIELLIGRYLGAFGPAPLKDVASWMGFNVGQLRHVADRMELRSFRDEDGRGLVDLPDGDLPDEATPAPVRFIAVWDAMLLVHARRTGVLPEEHRPRIFNTKAPHSFNTFLVDGMVAGTWRFEDGRIQLDPFGRLGREVTAELDAEAERLAAFHAD